MNKVPKIAVVGGGIGGTAAAYFLHELFGDGSAVVHVYEYNQVGGRLATLEMNNREYEIGGSIIHQRNKYMVDFVQALGLQKRRTGNSRFGLFDGEEFLFTESKWEILNLVKLAWRYGYGPVKLQRYIDNLLTKFERIYSLQSEGKVFISVTELLGAMSPQFVSSLKSSTKQGFLKSGFSERLIEELIAATLTANYGQDTTVHEFVGSVSVAGASGGLWAVEGGNRIVPLKLLKMSQAILRQERVTNVTLLDDERFLVTSMPSKESHGQNGDIYDIVIIATPLTRDIGAHIIFSNFPVHLTFPGEYHRTVCTMVRGKINHTWFGFDHENDMIDEVLTVKLGLIFNSIGRQNSVDYLGQKMENVSDIWKIFSQTPLTEQQLNELFLQRKQVNVTDWLAYPHYSHKGRNDTFVLYKRMFHVNAIEWAASAMEMSVISAKNAALLSYNSWHGVNAANFLKSLHEEL